MATPATPEAEPKAPKEQSEKKEGGKKGDAVERVSAATRQEIINQYLREHGRPLGGDGAKLESSPALERKLLDQHLEQDDHKHDLPYALAERSYEVVRRPIWQVLNGALLVANPVVYGIVRGGDALARPVLSRVPLLGWAYEKGRSVATLPLRASTKVLSMGAAIPGFILDRLEDLYEGITRTMRKESRTTAGRRFEWATEKMGLGIRKGAELGWEGAKKLAWLLGQILAAPLRLEGAVNAGVSQVPYIGKLGHIVSIPVTLAGLHFLGAQVLPIIFPQGALWYAQFIEWLTKVVTAGG